MSDSTTALGGTLRVVAGAPATAEGGRGVSLHPLRAGGPAHEAGPFAAALSDLPSGDRPASCEVPRIEA
jgi:hypothetical protein